MGGKEGWLDVKKKTVVKILLDILMLAVTALMYSSHALGMAFHEFGGLALIGVFFIHKGLNFEWIRRVTARLFRVDGRTRVKWIVDALLLLGFLAVGVSGILISKVAFSGLATQGGPWKAIHYGSATLSLILVGVHMGLHLDFLKGVFSRWVRLPRVVAALLTVAVMASGVYGLATTSFFRWLSMPFTASAGGGEGFHGGSGENGLRGDKGGQFPDENQAADGDSATDSAIAQTSGEDSATGQVSGSVKGLGDPGSRESAGSITGALSTLAQFASIAFLFAALTAFLDAALRRKKRQAIA